MVYQARKENLSEREKSEEFRFDDKIQLWIALSMRRSRAESVWEDSPDFP